MKNAYPLIPSIRPLAIAGVALLLLSAPAVHAQTLNLPTNLGIGMQQYTEASSPGSMASNDGYTNNSTALNYSNTRNDTDNNGGRGTNVVARDVTTSATLSYEGATTFTGALDSYGSRGDGGTYLPDGVHAITAGDIEFTVSALAPYTLSGSFLATVISGTPQLTAYLMLVNSTETPIFSENFSTTSSASDPFTNNLTGTLAPGTYSLQFDNECLFDAVNGTVSAGDLDYTFQVGTVVPEPSTWATVGLLGVVTLRRRTAHV